MKIFSPADQQKKIGEILPHEIASQSIIDEQFIQAEGLYKKWSSCSLDTRREIMDSLLTMIPQSIVEHQTTYVQETGRPAADIFFEIQQFKNWKQKINQDWPALKEMQGVPVGNILIVVPMVWPIHYAFAYSILSLLAGNAVWIKFSEVGCLTGLKILSEIKKQHPELPLFGLVADSEGSRRIVLHPKIDLVLFFGSTEAGSRIKQDAIGQPNKELALNMGSRNLGLITGATKPSPEFDRIIFDSCFRSMGVHCRAVNTLLIPELNMKEWADSIYKMAKSFPVGDPRESVDSDQPLLVGPLPNASMVDRYLKWIGMIEREGADLIMRGKVLERKTKGNFVAPTIAAFKEYSPDRFKKSVVQQTELLGPMLQLIPYKNYDEVHQYMASCHYGLVALVLGDDLNECGIERFQVGSVARNKATIQMDFSNTLIASKKSGAGAVQGIGLFRRLSRKTFIE